MGWVALWDENFIEYSHVGWWLCPPRMAWLLLQSYYHYYLQYFLYHRNGVAGWVMETQVMHSLRNYFPLKPVIISSVRAIVVVWRDIEIDVALLKMLFPIKYSKRHERTQVFQFLRYSFEYQFNNHFHFYWFCFFLNSRYTIIALDITEESYIIVFFFVPVK